MSQWPPFSRLPRVVLWFATILVLALVTLSKPVSWAAPVTAPRHQTVPPGETSVYLPTLHRDQRDPCAQSEATLVGTLKDNSGFSTLLQTLEAANLTDALGGAGPFTIFAPTGAAFAGLPTGALEQLLANPTGQLTQILLFHIVPGHVELDDLQDGMQITTQQGKSIHVERGADCEVRINGARILTPNLQASNGVIHVIDTVILPPPD